MKLIRAKLNLTRSLEVRTQLNLELKRIELNKTLRIQKTVKTIRKTY